MDSTGTRIMIQRSFVLPRSLFCFLFLNIVLLQSFPYHLDTLLCCVAYKYCTVDALVDAAIYYN